MTAEEYMKAVSSIASVLSAIPVGLDLAGVKDSFAELIDPFFKLVPPIAAMFEEGRDPTDAERTALVGFRHKLSAALQAIPTGQ